MSRWAKVGLVSGGYLAAVIIAIGAALLYDARVSSFPYDTSGGMYAGGEALSALAAFLIVALAPTLLGLWFLRRNERFWNAVALLSIVFAGVGLVAVLLPLATHGSVRSAALFLLELVALAHLLGAPLWVTAFGLFAAMAPTPRVRRRLIAALGIELVVGVCALVHWFVPRPPF